MTNEMAQLIPGPAGRLHVDDGGTGGIPVVFVHSFAGSSAQWPDQLAHLRETRRAVAFDLRGHGRSDPPRNGDYSVPALAADIGAVLDALSIAKAVLVGHSLGAAAAIAYASAQPDRVAGLVLDGAPARLPKEMADKVMAGMESDYEASSASINNRLLEGARPATRVVVQRDAKRMSREPALQIIKATFAFDAVPALERYPGPKLAVTTPAGDTPNDLHHLVSDLPREEIAGTSHWIQVDKPDEFNQVLDWFLAGVRVRQGA